GSVCFDDFSLAVVEGDAVKPIALTNPDFSRDDFEGWSTPSESWTYERADEQGNTALCMRRKTEPLDPLLFEPLPEPGEILDLPLAAGLRVRLPVALPDSLARQPPPAGQPPPELDAADPAVRAAAVIVGWNVLRHFYPYFDVIDEDWDAVLDQTLADLLDDRSPEDLQLTLERMVAKLHDGHGRVHGPIVRGLAPVELARVEGKVIVIAAREGSGLAPGDELLAIDEVPIAEVFAEAATRVSGSPQWIDVLLLRWAVLTAGPKEQPARLSLRRGDQTFDVELVRELQPAKFPAARPAIEVYKDKVVYVDLARASWPEIEARLPELARAPGVVFDLRGYPNSNHDLLQHLLREPDEAEWMFLPQFIYPDQQRLAGWTALGWNMTPAEPHIAGKVVFLTDARAISYAESVMGL